eukprot:3349305-Rhodomonas_salina.1
MIVSSTQVILSEVTCSEETGDAFQDYIPLHEISKVERSMFSNEDESSITRVPSLDANLNSHRRPSALQGLLPVRLRGSMRSQGPPEEGQGGMFEIHTSEDGRNSGVRPGTFGQHLCALVLAVSHGWVEPLRRCHRRAFLGLLARPIASGPGIPPRAASVQSASSHQKVSQNAHRAQRVGPRGSVRLQDSTHGC